MRFALLVLAVLPCCVEPAHDEPAAKLEPEKTEEARAADDAHRARMAEIARQMEATRLESERLAAEIKAKNDARCAAGGLCFYDVENAGSWKVATQRDPITDNVTHVATLFSTSHVDSITIRCSLGKTALHLSTAEYLGLGGQNVGARLDGGAPEKWWGREASSNDALFFRGDLAPRLRKHKTLLLQYTPYDKGPITAEFNMAGIEAATTKLAEVCKWQPLPARP